MAWYPVQMQTEDLVVPASVDQLLSDYAKRFHQIKTPRKLLWKKNLGTVKVRKTNLIDGYYENCPRMNRSGCNT